MVRFLNMRMELGQGQEVGSRPEDGYKWIVEANDWKQLYNALRQYGTVSGSKKVYTGEELIDLINRVQTGKAEIDSITRTGGLRDKVEELLGRRQGVEIENGSSLVEKSNKMSVFWPEGLDNRMRQGPLGDCYFIAALHSMKRNPLFNKRLDEMMDINPDGSWTVHFKEGHEEIKVHITQQDLDEAKEAERGILEGSLGDKVLERAYARLAQRDKERGFLSKVFKKNADNTLHGSGNTVHEGKMAIEGGVSARVFSKFFGRDNVDVKVKPVRSGKKFVDWFKKASDNSIFCAGSYRTRKVKTLDQNEFEVASFHTYSIELAKNGNHVVVTNPYDSSVNYILSFEEFAKAFSVVDVGSLKT